jgi:hypothetical protein
MKKIIDIKKSNANFNYYILVEMVYIVLLLTVNSDAYSKKPNYKIAETEFKNGYNYIPKSALEDSIDIILHDYNSDYKSLNKKFGKPKIKVQEIEISWNSNCTDGAYKIIITPQQMYVCSGHDNPNPNSLYWVQEIDSIKFHLIKKGLLKKKPKIYISYNKNFNSKLDYNDTSYVEIEIPENWSDSVSNKFDIDCDSLIIHTISKQLTILNNYLPQEMKFDTSKTGEYFLKRSKYFFWTKQDIDSILEVNNKDEE